MNSISPHTMNRIATIYSQLLATEASNANGGNSATVSCKITIGNITGDLNNNCTVVISNSCGASDSSLVLLDIAYQKILQMEHQEDVDLMLSYSKIRSDCIAKTILNQDITIHDINLGVCKPKFPVLFNFINSGNATSNCIMNDLIIDSLKTVSATPDDSIQTRVNSRDVEDSILLSFLNKNYIYIMIIGLLFGGLAISHLIYTIRMSSNIITYKKDNIIEENRKEIIHSNIV
jgi:hypothetical protein